MIEHRARSYMLLLVVLLAAWLITFMTTAQNSAGTPTPIADSVAMGRKVYIEEGCIHCHSQYVRPHSRDVAMWGPYRSLDEVLAQRPVLIGNRQQGPDLLNVGNRRSPEWNRLHLINPQRLSPFSVMPSYAYLFSKDAVRGKALVAYLSSLGRDTMEERLDFIRKWKPQKNTDEPDFAAGRLLYEKNCLQCHGEQGRGDGPVAAQLTAPPRNLAEGRWLFIPKNSSAEDKAIGLARIIKFGIPGTNMPGHEYLSDNSISNLVHTVQHLPVNSKK